VTAVVGRRGVLGGGVAVLLAGCGDAARTAPPSGRIRYDTAHPSQYAVLGRPTGAARALVVLLHGGFWQAAYGLDLMEPVAADLRRHGYATWNVEYRRVGDGGGWPSTFADVARAVDHVRTLGRLADLPIVLVGHSSGGHLAAWVASRGADTPGGRPRARPTATVSLSGVLDLTTAADQRVGGDAVAALMGSGPTESPDRYAAADPVRRVPAHGAVTAVHAVDDTVVPLDQSRRYVAAAVAAGGDAALVTVPGGHFALIDPAGAAWAEVRSAIAAAAGAPTGP
jgi:acetyl esterase/lipase